VIAEAVRRLEQCGIVAASPRLAVQPPSGELNLAGLKALLCCWKRMRSSMAAILLIDDEPMLRRTIRTMLERAGHTVSEAGGGADGVSAFRQKRPDLVLTDMAMPDGEGVECIRELQSLDAAVPIIAMSGGGSVGGTLYLTLASQAGAQQSLQKPFRRDALLAAVDSCLGHAG
jgi:DNA-binding NtrC family response regulator